MMVWSDVCMCGWSLTFGPSHQVPTRAAPSFFERMECTLPVRRTNIPPRPNKGINLWSLMKNCIGKDLSKIPLPVCACVCVPMCVCVCACVCVCVWVVCVYMFVLWLWFVCGAFWGITYIFDTLHDTLECSMGNNGGVKP